MTARQRSETEHDMVLDAIADGNRRLQALLRAMVRALVRPGTGLTEDEARRIAAEYARRMEEAVEAVAEAVFAAVEDGDGDSFAFVPPFPVRGYVEECLGADIGHLAGAARADAALGIAEDAAVADILSHMGDRYPTGNFPAALAAGIALSPRGGRGRGNYLSLPSGLRRILQSYSMHGYDQRKRHAMAAAGAAFYRTYRRSNYDCPACDAVAAVLHPVGESVLPVHPWCVCGMYEAGI